MFSRRSFRPGASFAEASWRFSGGVAEAPSAAAGQAGGGPMAQLSRAEYLRRFGGAAAAPGAAAQRRRRRGDDEFVLIHVAAHARRGH